MGIWLKNFTHDLKGTFVSVHPEFNDGGEGQEAKRRTNRVCIWGRKGFRRGVI